MASCLHSIKQHHHSAWMHLDTRRSETSRNRLVGHYDAAPMAPIVEPIARSDTKVRFMTCLGLDISKRLHREVYNAMKLEANEGRKRIIAELDEQARRNDQLAARRTYSTSQIDESIMNSEAAWIYEHAQPVTKPLYHLGHDLEHPSKPNWVIRWMLWHVFRYKDGRQKVSSTHARATASPSNASSDVVSRTSTASDSPNETDSMAGQTPPMFQADEIQATISHRRNCASTTILYGKC
ncbi:hypothetical protein HII31_11967 [Pseudocercospora fuligena]|uniref:Uncharacterized protein n=1 Tax=Pseudocercospora fuligena TaxID=685502 RepID=A0A8H6R7H3_9PEZI|nr:hypothetical protein HII31_11967 [Pseudocercospora fuligena]